MFLKALCATPKAVFKLGRAHPEDILKRTKLSREGPKSYPNCLDKVGLTFMIRLVDGGFVYEDKGRPISSQPKHSPFAQITLTKCSKRVGGREKF